MQFKTIGPGTPESIWLYVVNGHTAALAKDTWVAYAFASGNRDGAKVVPITLASNGNMPAGVVTESIPVGDKGYIAVWGVYPTAMCVGGATTAELLPGGLMQVKTNGGSAETMGATGVSCGVFLEPTYTAAAGSSATPFHARVLVRCL